MLQHAKNVYHLGKAMSAHVLYGFPATSTTFIGVTGTDGKTTTSNMIYHILSKAGKKAAVISTVGAIINGQEYDTGFHVTTPDPFSILSYIKKAKEAKSDYIILEVTSHALDQNRVFGIPFSIGVLTNITREHLDYHKTYENYVKAKCKLFRHSKTVVINRDDSSYGYVMNEDWQKARDKEILTYGLNNQSDLNPSVFQFKTNLLGDFNQYNCLAAIAVCRKLGIADTVIRDGLLDFTPPKGRTEIVHEDSFMVMVDFAHTPNSIDRILSTIKKENRRIIHVFGSAGLRDKGKRPLMGEASAKYADIIILTAEDPRTEKVEDINASIEQGIPNAEFRKKQKTLVEIPDRQEAISYAIMIAQEGDVVVVTGKGHEQSMNTGKGEEEWSDHEAVEIALQKRDAAKKS